MSDSKARLHCCGTHHHQDSTTPTGLTLSIATRSGAPVTCYGTGDNTSSAVLLVPDSLTYTWDGTATRVLADDIARGANVTVLVPHLQGDNESRKRRRDEDESGTGVRVGELSSLARTLKESMDVMYLGLLLPSSNAAAPVDDLGNFDCLVTFATDESAAAAVIPTSRITVSETEAREASSTQDQAVTVRTVTVKSKHASRVLASGSHEGYPETMREVLYFFKKHLHDWS